MFYGLESIILLGWSVLFLGLLGLTRATVLPVLSVVSITAVFSVISALLFLTSLVTFTLLSLGSFDTLFLSFGSFVTLTSVASFLTLRSFTFFSAVSSITTFSTVTSITTFTSFTFVSSLSIWTVSVGIIMLSWGLTLDGILGFGFLGNNSCCLCLNLGLFLSNFWLRGWYFCNCWLHWFNLLNFGGRYGYVGNDDLRLESFMGTIFFCGVDSELLCNLYGEFVGRVMRLGEEVSHLGFGSDGSEELPDDLLSGVDLLDLLGGLSSGLVLLVGLSPLLGDCLPFGDFVQVSLLWIDLFILLWFEFFLGC